YFAAGTALSVAFDAASGMKFHGWAQDLTGSANPQPLVMDSPHSITALLDRLPEKPPAPRVTNLAPDTPGDAGAAGSIALLLRTDLSAGAEAATSNPLPQTLAGVSLLCGGRFLPLLYVSPQQINFQVPGDLKPGQYPLEVHRGTAPSLKLEINVARNAPGLLA